MHLYTGSKSGFAIRPEDALRPQPKLPDAAERLRVNMGFQCPECFGPNVNTPERQHHECRDCGCHWDRYRYPALAIKS